MPLALSPETEARILQLAAERAQSPDALIENALDTLPAVPLPQPQTEEEEQERLHREFNKVLAKARAISFAVPDEPSPNTQELTPGKAEYGRIVTEKFRRQGFNV